MSEKDKGKTASQVKHLPKDAQVIMSIMKEAGITEYEPRVVNQLLEFTYLYVTSVIDDARVFANHAKKKTIDLEDVKLAAQMQLDKSFTNPPPREVLLEIARVKNVISLPLIKPHCGIRLPPDRYCLSSCNYKLKPTVNKKVVPKPAAVTPTIKTVTSSKPTGTQNMVMKRQPGAIVNTPSKQTVPKPVLKFTSGSKVVAKPAVRVTAGPSVQGTIKMEVDDMTSGAHKRKREDDDYDI